jgi:hypothetical protein
MAQSANLFRSISEPALGKSNDERRWGEGSAQEARTEAGYLDEGLNPASVGFMSPP